MKIQLVLLLVILLAAAFLVFAIVRKDYQTLGKLSRFTAIMQTGYFCAYALSSYAFLDSRLSQISITGLLLLTAIAFMAIGFLVVAFSMPFLGRRSFGREVGSLRMTGLYRYSRNPQLVGGFLFVVGYAMLWLSWAGMLWASLWLAIAHWMVKCEEMHLQNIFGDEYRVYCARTPRYLGFPKK